MNRIYIVTGANGFLGNNIIRKLVQFNNEIRSLVLPNGNIKSLAGLNTKIYYGDVTKKESLKNIFNKNDDEEFVVIHCAAIVYIKSKYNPMVNKVNVGGTSNIIDKCLETKSKLIYINSVHAIPEPVDNRKIVEINNFDANLVEGIYAKSKSLACRLVIDSVRNKNLNAVILQPSGIIGPNDFGMTHMTKLILTLAQGKLFAIVKGGYDFVDVRDVTDGIISSINNGQKGECYILSNHYATIKEISDLVSKKCNIRRVKIILPITFAKFIAPIYELCYNLKKEIPLFTKYSLYTLKAKSNFNHQKATNQLKYKTRSLEDTISDTIDWFRNNKEID